MNNESTNKIGLYIFISLFITALLLMIIGGLRKINEDKLKDKQRIENQRNQNYKILGEKVDENYEQ